MRLGDYCCRYRLRLLIMAMMLLLKLPEETESALRAPLFCISMPSPTDCCLVSSRRGSFNPEKEDLVFCRLTSEFDTKPGKVSSPCKGGDAVSQ